MLEELIEALLPYIVGAIGSVVMLLWGQAAVYAKRKWGIQIEAIDRAALHSAIATGVDLVTDKGMTADQRIEAVKDYVAKSVPGALRKLAPSPDVLTSLIVAKMTAAVRRGVT
ncbi:MAG: hypothetical protein ACU0BO_13910 [Limimaricola soesokkakensis]